MTEAEELEWLRSWRSRLLEAMRRWWKPSSYQDACNWWTKAASILAEKPPTDEPDRKAKGQGE